MMNKTLRSFCILALCTYFLTACSSQSKKEEIPDVNLVEASYVVADALLVNAEKLNLNRTKPLLVASFVNVDDVQQSSTLGRMIAEQIGSRISQSGLKVVEVKLRSDSIFVKGNQYPNEGEFLLSRELKDLSSEHDAVAVVVGTYAESKSRVYVTAKMLNTHDNSIMASFDYSLPIGADIKQMLRNDKRRR
ncbi:FlgO family outer membrane protein [Beggiatoa leptomitoformis]|uniref:FlgO domain-containing protein n=1 Tax=Beggiatoa leptomitoformis TaxID=288004 RepID=A0A2N9YIF8_9GAMM|nr:FlgO family outer membrane protein [Beggiatoa leptomitoformis]ALG67494.1 hypothetical protein AL038_06995 [Beggiatoa leptomitoformis]AUI70284.1 hypothetical protein BLE401_17315 [Beggiatoa leptomitoformis]